MNILKYILALSLIIWLNTSCSPSLTSGTSGDYYEDLSVLRPVYTMPETEEEPEVILGSESVDPGKESPEIEPEFHITNKLDSLLDTIAVNNQKIRYIQGYTIQVYTGNSQDEANKAKAKVYQALPGSRPSVTYDLPNYKVKVGKYYYRLQAQKEFATIKKVFPSAILAPQQFRIE